MNRTRTKFHNLRKEVQQAIHIGMVFAGTIDPNRQTDREFAEKNGKFREACEAAGVKPTKRQAAKFRRKIGSAYNDGR
jgi:hypothetical protein